MTKFQKSPVEKKRAPKPECKDVCVPRRRKPGTKPGGGPHDILIKAMGEEEARRRCVTLRLTVGGLTGRHDGPTAPPQRPLVREAPAVKYPERHLCHVQHSHSHPPPARVKRHQPRCTQEWPPSARLRYGLSGPSSLPGNTHLGSPSTQDRSQPRPIVNTIGSVVPPFSSRHPPGVEGLHNRINKTDTFGAAQATQLPFGCISMRPCTQVMHVPIQDYASRPTTFMPETNDFQAVVNGKNSQASANINLHDWQPRYGANSTLLQGRWPQDPTGPRYPPSGFADEPPLQQAGANLDVYRGLEPAPVEAGQPIPIAPDMLDIQVANNGLHNWQTWRRPVHPTVAPVQAFWPQDTIGEWYPHPKYEEEVPIHRASANFGPPPAAYQDFRGPSMDATIRYNLNTTTYQAYPTRKPVATVDEGSVTDPNVSPHEYWLWLVGGTSVECVEERRE